MLVSALRGVFSVLSYHRFTSSLPVWVLFVSLPARSPWLGPRTRREGSGGADTPVRFPPLGQARGPWPPLCCPLWSPRGSSQSGWGSPVPSLLSDPVSTGNFVPQVLCVYGEDDVAFVFCPCDAMYDMH